MEAAIRLVLDEIWPATPGSPSGNAITGRLLGGRHFQSAHFLGGRAKKKSGTRRNMLMIRRRWICAQIAFFFFFQTAKFRYCGLPPSVSAICWLHLTPTTNVNHLHKICIKKRSHLCLMFQKLNLNGSTWPSDVTGVSCRHGHRRKTLSSWSKCKCLHRIRINLSRSDHVLHSNAAVCWLSVAVERCT